MVVLLARKALFRRSGDDAAIADQAGSAVVVKGGNSKDVCHVLQYPPKRPDSLQQAILHYEPGHRLPRLFVAERRPVKMRPGKVQLFPADKRVENRLGRHEIKSWPL